MDIPKRLDTMLMLYMGISSIFLFTIGTTFNGGVGLTAKYLAAPLAIIVFAFTYVRSRGLPTKTKINALLLFGVLIYPMILLFAWPYVLAFNALAATGETIAISGGISRKSTSGAKSTAYIVSIRNQQLDEDVQISVSKRDYDHMAIGDSYKFCYYQGRLGIPYFWRFLGQPQC
jgi:hypothetical protein